MNAVAVDLILKLRVKPWKVPLSEAASCGDLVSTAKTTVLPANDYSDGIAIAPTRDFTIMSSPSVADAEL